MGLQSLSFVAPLAGLAPEAKSKCVLGCCLYHAKSTPQLQNTRIGTSGPGCLVLKHSFSKWVMSVDSGILRQCVRDLSSPCHASTAGCRLCASESTLWRLGTVCRLCRLCRLCILQTLQTLQTPFRAHEKEDVSPMSLYLPP